ncbi:hypothetical protein HY214_04115 [Candidatus Roizmanbacteria bacterium]|nr:hypothetical protein [Candidatus Roizmanbacteria bacterium]
MTVTRREFGIGLGTAFLGAAACALLDKFPITLTAVPPSGAISLVEGLSLPGDWPSTPEQVVSALGGKLKPEYVVKKLDANNKWTGIWDVEAFPLKPGVRYDARQGFHVDPTGNRITDPRDIFDFGRQPDWLTLTLQTDSAVAFMRSGGNAPNPKLINISRFAGTKGATAEKVEQAALIPPPRLVCPDNGPSSVAAWRQAVSEVSWNEDVRKGRVTVQWYDPDQNNFVPLELGTLARLVEQNINIDVIWSLPADWPLTTKQLAAKVGGEEKYWRAEVNDGRWTGRWQMEVFPLKPGVQYDDANGLYVKNWIILTDPNTIYDFNNYGLLKTAPKTMTVGHPNAYLFVRTGGAYPQKKDAKTSWFAWRKNTAVTVPLAGFEPQFKVVKTKDE